eukprot:s1405_g9.t1
MDRPFEGSSCTGHATLVSDLPNSMEAVCPPTTLADEGETFQSTLFSQEGAFGPNSDFLATLAFKSRDETGVAGDGDLATRTAWFKRLTQCSTLQSMGIMLAWGCQAGYLEFRDGRARPTRAAASKRSGLFPLPVMLPRFDSPGPADGKSCETLEQSIGCWVAVAAAASSTKAWWQVYLDNFMSGEISSGDNMRLSESLQSLAMQAWGDAGVLTAADKQVVNERQITELGVRIDGNRQLLGGSPARLLKTIYVTLHHLLNKSWSRKEAQIILGRWIFLLQFRRAGMSVLSRSWDVLNVAWPSRAQLGVLYRELLMLVCLGPLIQADLSSTFDGAVSCSDASESGGACALSAGLSWSGRSLVAAKNDPRLGALKQPLLLISIFNGIGGCFRVYDILGIEPEGRISIENNRFCNRVVRTAWPDTIELHDILSISREEVFGWAAMFPHISEVHMMAGFPCVHLSSARAYRRNLDGEGSDLFWTLLKVLSWIQEAFSGYAKVKFTIENVASMDETARQQISEELDISPVKLDPCDAMPYSRPRLAWCSEELYEMDGLQLWKERDYTRAYASAPPLQEHQWIRPGWSWGGQSDVKFPTFMKNIKRAVPPPKPAGLERTSEETRARWRADSYRYPPYQYREQFLLHDRSLPSRLLDASERELLLGFGPGHTAACMSASEAKKNKQEYEDVRCSLCGDSFSILSFAIMGACMAAEMVPRMSPATIVQRLGLAPGFSAHPTCIIPMTRWLAYGTYPDKDFQSVELVDMEKDSLFSSNVSWLIQEALGCSGRAEGQFEYCDDRLVQRRSIQV